MSGPAGEEDLEQPHGLAVRPFAVIGLDEGELLYSALGLSARIVSWEGKPAVALVPDAGASLPLPGAGIDGFAADLKSLHEVSLELARSPDENELCRSAVELGRKRLGFERVGLHLVDPSDPGWFIGRWTTDDKGRVRDERGLRTPRGEARLPKAFYDGSLALFSDGVPAAPAPKAESPGSRAVAPLWDGRRFLGELEVSTRGGRILDEAKREVIVLFARVVAQLTSLKRAEAELRVLASTDSLTGAVNRRIALIILEKQLGLALRNGTPLTVCVADLDHLKRVNDGFGHAAGDAYITSVCRALVKNSRSSDTVGRLGGDEFLMLLPDCGSEEAATIMERVESDIAAEAADLPYSQSLSWGLASIDDLGSGSCSDAPAVRRCMDEIVGLADRRMYEVKRKRQARRKT
jgi:diguanylate cyclase (GGDEF)-like protein